MTGDKPRGIPRERPAVFIDRDGTLIEEKDYLTDPGEVVLQPGAAEAISQLNREGFPVVVVTNQSGVARGYCTEADVEAVHERLQELLSDRGARLDGLYYCPHHPEGTVPAYRKTCSCRKPALGMLERASDALRICLPGSYMIGDKLTDMEMARRAGLTGILVRTGYGQEEWKRALRDPEAPEPSRVAWDLAEATAFVLWMERHLAAVGKESAREEGGDRLWSSKWASFELVETCIGWHRARGETIVMANGAFDLLHVGHVGYLRAAKGEGDVLVVAVNDDRSVRDLKGAGRPILPVDERVEIVGALACVDYCLVLRSRTADRVLARIRPDIHAKGSDYTPATVPERETVRGYGGQVRIVGPAKTRSTTRILERLGGLSPQR